MAGRVRIPARFSDDQGGFRGVFAAGKEADACVVSCIVYTSQSDNKNEG